MNYKLGRNVTDQAKAKENRGTVVISFRIKADEFDRLCELAKLNERTVSEEARKAFRIGLMPFMESDTAGSPSTTWST